MLITFYSRHAIFFSDEHLAKQTKNVFRPLNKVRLELKSMKLAQGNIYTNAQHQVS
jgi:hypothetical protein